MLKKIILFYSFVIFLTLIEFKPNISYGEEYLDTVIEKINKMESDLLKLQEESNNSKMYDSAGVSSNIIASHEKRLLDLEEEFRTLNGRIDEVLFDLKNISNELLDLKTIKVNDKITAERKNNDVEQEEDNLNNSEDEENIKAVETITSEDPNMKDNPSMQVLGVIKENQTTNTNNRTKEVNRENEESSNNIQKSNSETEKQLANLSKNPSDIYKHAYNMLIQENFLEAERYFNIFIGENPNDPLTSNAYYWLGETFYVQKQFQKAAISFAKGYQKFPKGNKALDQLYKLSLTFINLGKNEDACASFSKLDLEFPNAPKRIKSRIKDYKVRAKC